MLIQNSRKQTSKKQGEDTRVCVCDFEEAMFSRDDGGRCCGGGDGAFIRLNETRDGNGGDNEHKYHAGEGCD